MHWFLVKLMAPFSTKCFQAKRKGPSALPELTSLGCGLSNVRTITTTAQCWTSLKKDQHEDLDLLTLTQIQIANFINKNFSWKGLLSRFFPKGRIFHTSCSARCNPPDFARCHQTTGIRSTLKCPSVVATKGQWHGGNKQVFLTKESLNISDTSVLSDVWRPSCLGCKKNRLYQSCKESLAWNILQLFQIMIIHPTRLVDVSLQV